MIFLHYTDLEALIAHSSSTRAYFLSLPVEAQLRLHEHGACIHSAAGLHRYAAQLEHHERAVRISAALFRRPR